MSYKAYCQSSAQWGYVIYFIIQKLQLGLAILSYYLLGRDARLSRSHNHDWSFYFGNFLINVINLS